MDEERLDHLINQHFNQSLEPDERSELEQALLESREARERFWELAKINAALWQWGRENWGSSRFSVESAGCALGDEEPFAERKKGARPARRLHPLRALAASLAFLAAMTAVFLAREEPERARFAVIGDSIDAEWRDGVDPPEVGSELGAEWLRLRSGAVELEFVSGAHLVLEGPAAFRIGSENGGELLHGRIAVSVPEAARGFEVLSGDVSVIDYGTEFGVLAAQDGPLEVHVFDGEVGVRSEQLLGRELALTRNAAVRLQGSAQVELAADADAFFEVDEFERMMRAGRLAQYAAWQDLREAIVKRPDLVGYLDFQRSDDFVFGLRNHATQAEAAVIGARFVEGRWMGKSALEFDAPADRVRLTLPDQFDSLSLFAWVRVEDTPNRLNSLLMAETNEELGEFHWYLYRNGNLGIGVRDRPRGSRNQWWHVHTPAPAAGETIDGWTFVATVFDRDAGRLTHYVNGRPAGSEAIAVTHALRLGVAEVGNWDSDFGSGDAYNFTGAIGELGVFASALDDDEIRALFEAGRPARP